MNSNKQNHQSLTSLPKTFFIRPKATGLVSLFIQAVVLLVSATTTMFFFYHVGGYEYTHWNENSTILEPITHNSHRNLPIEENINPDEWLVSTSNRSLSFLDSRNQPSSTVHHKDMIENASFGIEQVPVTTVFIGDFEFDWLEVIRLSTIISICVSIIWVISGILFIATIRCEILDTVIFNSNILILVDFLFFAHAGLISSLIFFQREMSWRTMSITIGSLVIIVCSAFLGGICIALNFAWVRYITYMRGEQNCFVVSICCCVNRKSNQSSKSEQNQTESTRKSNDDVQLAVFNAF